MIFLSSGSLVCSVPWELFLTKRIQGQKNMPQVIQEKRAAHLVSYTFFTRDVDQYKKTSLWQVYQPSRTPFSLKACNFLKNKLPTPRGVLSCEVCEIFQNNSGGCFCNFLKEYLKSYFPTLLWRTNNFFFLDTLLDV